MGGEVGRQLHPGCDLPGGEALVHQPHCLVVHKLVMMMMMMIVIVMIDGDLDGVPVGGHRLPDQLLPVQRLGVLGSGHTSPQHSGRALLTCGTRMAGARESIVSRAATHCSVER